MSDVVPDIHIDCGGLDTSSNDNDDGTCEHSRATTKIIIDWACQQNGRDASDVVNGKYNASGRSCRATEANFSLPHFGIE